MRSVGHDLVLELSLGEVDDWSEGYKIPRILLEEATWLVAL